MAADRQEPERAAAGSALGQEAFSAALERGRRMSVEELLASGG